MLVSGSSHNFIHIGMVKKLCWKVDQSLICDVMIVDGGQIQCKGCFVVVPLAIGNYGYTYDMFALPLGGCDIVTIASQEMLDSCRTTHLREMSLIANRLTGSIPREFGSIATLESLTLEDNLLGGSLHPDLGNLRSLKRL
ncbi:hypothetical protein DKX38_017610 [Salix brachista]|uniref:Uncharacterized protein n=1 Tax=Salix brachista TaxID=2182728 RepID=A0A5N5KVR7_9ROSI|nr:hypothetical protein DKX38_017610 [Salix brachista]